MTRMNEMGGEKAGGEGGGMAEQAREATSQVGQQAREIGGRVRDMAREQYDHLRDQASEYYQQGKQTAQEWQESLESYVQDRPMKALLIAAGVGLLVGVLLKRR